MFTFGLLFGLIGVVALLVTLRRSKGAARLRVGFRPDGHIRSMTEDRVGLTFKAIPVDSVSAMLVGVVNAGGSRINTDSTEEPVLIKFASGEATFLAVDVGMAQLMDDQTLMIEVEQLHAGERREVRVQYDGDEEPTLEVSGKIKDLARPIERYTGPTVRWIKLIAVVLLLLVVMGIVILGASAGWGPFRSGQISSVEIPEEVIDDVGELVDTDLSDFRSPSIKEDPAFLQTLPVVITSLAFMVFYLWALASDFRKLRSISDWVGLTRPTPFTTVESKDF